MSEQHAERVHRAIDALNDGSLEPLIEMCDPDGEWIAIPGFLPDAEDFHGPAAVRAWFERSATHSGRTSGVAGELRIFQSITMKNGRLARLESYLTRTEAAQAAGLPAD